MQFGMASPPKKKRERESECGHPHPLIQVGRDQRVAATSPPSESTNPNQDQGPTLTLSPKPDFSAGHAQNPQFEAFFDKTNSTNVFKTYLNI